MGDNVHHSFGPSSLKRRELCPGSFRMEKDLPGFETEHAAEGTMLHGQIAELIQKRIANAEIDETQYDERVINAYRYLCNIINSGTLKVEKILVEYNMRFCYCGIEKFHGTADVVIVCSDRVIIIDWKFGHREVDDAESNSQGAGYAVMAMKEFGKEIAEVHFFNPTIWQQTSTVFTDRNAIAKYLMGVIARAEKPDAPVIPSDDACRYCKAMHHGVCPAIAKTTELMVSKAEKIVPLPALSVLSEDELCELKEKILLIDKLSDRVDAELRRRIETNGFCGVWIIKEKSGGREVKNIQEAYKASGMSPNEFLENSCTCSISKLEKYFSKKMKENGTFKTEKEAKDELNHRLAAYIEKKPNKKELVKAGKVVR